MGFSRQEYWSGLPFPSGDLPGIEPTSPALAGRFFTSKSPEKPNNDRESQPCHPAGNLYQGKKKPVPGEDETDNETMLWALPDYVGRSKESWFSPLGNELFQLFICFDSKVMHEVMCKMCVT